MVKKGELDTKKTDALTRVAYKTASGETFEDPMFRADLRPNPEDQFMDLKDDLRDVRRRLKKKKGLMPYDLALDGPDDDEDSKPLTPATVHTFFKFKTPVFGVHCMDQVCLSNQGISVPSYYSLLAAKKPKGMRPTYDAHFDADEMDQWADAEAYEE